MQSVQKGFSSIVVLIIILLGIATTTYLVQTGVLFFPKAATTQPFSPKIRLDGQSCTNNNQCLAFSYCKVNSCLGYDYCQDDPDGGMCSLQKTLCRSACQPSPANNSLGYEVGLEPGAQADTSRVDLVSSTGAKWVRINFIGRDWDINSVDSKKYNQIIDAYRTKGMEVFGLIGTESVSGGYDRNNPQDFTQRFVDTADKIVENFGDRVKIFEIFNEPNDWVGGSSSVVPPRYFAIYLQEVYKKIKIEKQRRDILLLSGPILSLDVTTGVDYLKDTYNEGKTMEWSSIKTKTGNYPLDGISYHIYVAQGEGDKANVEAKIQENMNALQSFINQFDKGKKVWITEFGWGTRSGAVSEDTQSQNLEKAYLEFRNYPILRMAMWFTLKDFDPEEWGLLKVDNRQKKAWSTFSKIASDNYCGFEFKYPECDWDKNQLRDVYQDSCTGEYQYRNLRYEDNQCGLPPAEPSGPGCNLDYKYPECIWDTNQVRDVYQDSCIGEYKFKNYRFESGSCGYN